MTKKKHELATTNSPQIDENTIFEYVIKIIENRKQRASSFANSEITMMYWEIGQCQLCFTWR